jgi:hypothetical protein
MTTVEGPVRRVRKVERPKEWAVIGFAAKKDRSEDRLEFGAFARDPANVRSLDQVSSKRGFYVNGDPWHR